jgi:hypothetical protein
MCGLFCRGGGKRSRLVTKIVIPGRASEASEPGIQSECVKLDSGSAQRRASRNDGFRVDESFVRKRLASLVSRAPVR